MNRPLDNHERVGNFIGILILTMASLFFWAITTTARDKMSSDIELVNERLATTEKNAFIAMESAKLSSELLKEANARLTQAQERLDSRASWMVSFTDWVMNNVRDRFPLSNFKKWSNNLFELNPNLVKPDEPEAASFGSIPTIPK